MTDTVTLLANEGRFFFQISGVLLGIFSQKRSWRLPIIFLFFFTFLTLTVVKISEKKSMLEKQINGKLITRTLNSGFNRLICLQTLLSSSFYPFSSHLCIYNLYITISHVTMTRMSYVHLSKASVSISLW